MQENEDLVSIIMPVYNCAKYLEETLESVKKQTHKNWELIIVNDKSTDESLEILEQNSKKMSITIINNNENLGVAISRNKAINIAKGRFIAFLDGDDIWHKKKLENQISFMKKNDYSFTYTLFKYIKNNKVRTASNFIERLSYKQALKNTLILTSTVMIDTSKINKKLLEMPNIKRGQDTATWWKILKNGNIAFGLNEPLTLYRIGIKTSLASNKIIAINRTWKLYRITEEFSIIKSLYYFIFYSINALKRRMGETYEREME